MKVVHVDTAASWRGGQNQVLLTAQGQAARGHEVVVACRRGGALEGRAREAGIAVRALPFHGDLWPPAVVGLARALRETRPDVLQLHDPHAVGSGVAAARLAGGVASVATRRVDFRLRGPLSRWKYRSCARVIAVSRAIASVLEEDGLPPARLSLVYEGVPDRERPPGGHEALRALGVPEGSPVVGNVAALTGHKDHATLVDAAQVVLRRRPDVRFVIAGEGPLRRELESRVREQDRLLPAFTVFCLSSHLEGLGTSLLDAMAFGLPVVATAAGGIPEAVEHGVTGFIAPVRNAEALGQALLEVLEDPDLRRRFGSAGRSRFLERFTAERMVEDTLKVYLGMR
jgi:L-malate glycosyltransferase